MNKLKWKKIHRILRVEKRESLKASVDMMIFGTGAVMVPDDGAVPYSIRPEVFRLVNK